MWDNVSKYRKTVRMWENIKNMGKSVKIWEIGEYWEKTENATDVQFFSNIHCTYRGNIREYRKIWESQWGQYEKIWKNIVNYRKTRKHILGNMGETGISWEIYKRTWGNVGTSGKTGAGKTGKHTTIQESIRLCGKLGKGRETRDNAGLWENIGKYVKRECGQI